MKNLVLLLLVSVSFSAANANELRCRDMAIFRTISHLNSLHTNPDTKALYDYDFGEILESRLIQYSTGTITEKYKVRVQNDHPDSPRGYIVEFDNSPYFCKIYKINEFDLYP